MGNFINFDNYVLELILGAQGDFTKNLVDLANHLKIGPGFLIDYIVDLLESRDLSDDWGNLGSYEDKIGITQEDKTRLIHRIKHELH